VHVLLRFDDPWLNLPDFFHALPEQGAELFVMEPVTPHLVERLIRSISAAGWPAGGRPRRFVLDSSRNLIPAPADRPPAH
jgi:hypothetical protein